MSFSSNYEMDLIAQSLESIARSLASIVEDGIPGPGPCPSFIDWFGKTEALKQYCKLGDGHKSHWHESEEGTRWRPSDGKEII